MVQEILVKDDDGNPADLRLLSPDLPRRDRTSIPKKDTEASDAEEEAEE